MAKLLQITALTFILLFTASTSYAQKKGEEKIEIPAFVISEKTQKVVYNEVVEQKGATGELYEKALAWANKFYKSPSNVLRKKDKENGTLVAKSRYYIFYTDPKKGTKSRMHTIEYLLTIKFKDGRYRYEITDIIYKATSYQGIEQWIDENKEEYSYRTASYLVQIDDELNKIIDSFKSSIGTTEKTEEDW